jgi:predicted dehydrogenase
MNINQTNFNEDIMQEKNIRPVGIGYGRAGKVLEQALRVLSIQHPEWNLAPVQWLKRGQSFPTADGVQVALITTPHGLHAEGILDANLKGYAGIICEKPSCVSLEQLETLKQVKTPTAILHGYRQTWGARKLKNMIESGELGKIISIEGSYWQSSIADRRIVIERGGNPADGWKDDTKTSGKFDVLLDLGTHWTDFVSYLAGTPPWSGDVKLFYHNSPSEHRDSHVWIDMTFQSGVVSRGSISKTVHGAQNEFQIHVLGEKKKASWNFLRPDELRIGEGRSELTVVREDCDLGTRHPAFHGTGWLDGYTEISRQLLLHVATGKAESTYPELSENLKIVEFLIKNSKPIHPLSSPHGQR